MDFIGRYGRRRPRAKQFSRFLVSGSKLGTGRISPVLCRHRGGTRYQRATAFYDPDFFGQCRLSAVGTILSAPQALYGFYFSSSSGAFTKAGSTTQILCSFLVGGPCRSMEKPDVIETISGKG